jgi:hypothetical protein
MLRKKASQQFQLFSFYSVRAEVCKGSLRYLIFFESVNVASLLCIIHHACFMNNTRLVHTGDLKLYIISFDTIINIRYPRSLHYDFGSRLYT